MSRDKRRRQGPESAEYDKFKGKTVEIWPQNTQGTWIGKLVWVDTYTIGVAFNPKQPNAISIVYKAAIRIDPIDPNDVPMGEQF